MAVPNEYQDNKISQINLLRHQLYNQMFIPIVGDGMLAGLARMYETANELISAIEALSESIESN